MIMNEYVSRRGPVEWRRTDSEVQKASMISAPRREAIVSGDVTLKPTLEEGWQTTARRHGCCENRKNC